MTFPRQPRHRSGHRRRGVVTLMTIIAIPAVLILFCTVLEICHVWNARVELETVLEASALAAVKQWGDTGGGPTSAARDMGVQYAGANAVNGIPIVITDNYLSGGNPNENLSLDGFLVFGAIDTTVSPSFFAPQSAPTGTTDTAYGVRARGAVSVPSLCSSLMGLPVGPFEVSASAVAVFDAEEHSPRLVLVE